MKTLRFALIAGIVCCSVQVLHAQSQSDLRSQIIRNNREITAALVAGDTTPIVHFFSNSAVITNPAGGFVPHEELFRLVKDGILKYTSNEFSDVKVSQYGRAAVVTYLSTAAGTIDGHPVAPHSRWTQVWVMEHGEWKIVAIQGTDVVEAH